MFAIRSQGRKNTSLDAEESKWEELVANSGSDRNWKGMFIATLVILAVLGLIVLSVIWMTPPEDLTPAGEKISFQDFLSNNLSGGLFNGTWVSDYEIIYRDEYDGLSLLDVKTLRRIPLVPNTTYSNINAANYQISADKKFVLLAHDSQKMFRHSFWAKYTIYEVSTGSLFVIDGTPDPRIRDEVGGGRKQYQPFLEYLTWSEAGNAYAYVYRCNIYYKPSVKSEKVYPITSDGIPGTIFNGIPDWVYEEEILSQNNAIWFSPDGNRMAYVRFNDSDVTEIRMPTFEPDPTTPYWRYSSIRYPKAGTRNPTVDLFIVDLTDLANQKTSILMPPTIIRQSDHYIVSVSWINSTGLSVIWMNRDQNVSVVVHCLEQHAWVCYEVYRETARNSGWADLYSNPLYSKQSEEFLVRAPIMDGDHGHFRHILKVRFGDSAIQQPLTQGRFDISKINGWDSKRGYVYYTASPIGKPFERHLYRTGTSVNTSIDSPQCLTCHLVTFSNQTETEVNLLLTKQEFKVGSKIPLPVVEAAGGCMYNDAHFSKDMTYYVLECHGPEVPRVWLFRTEDNEKLTILNDNDELRHRAANMSLPKIRMMTVPLSSGYYAWVKLYLPPEITVHTFTSYPLIVDVYAGPGMQVAKHEWKQGWASYLSSSRGWIVAQIDGRGSGGEGDRRRFEIWHQLGSVEVADQIEVTKYLVDNLHIIDPRRIGVWGWSYGGYTTLRILSDEKQNLFQCGIAVAPVTNWRYYDSVYSERYMGQPGLTGNFKGYEDSDVMHRVHDFQANSLTYKKLFLIHGTSDDNVHMQHSMVLAKQLVQAGILFKQQIYPDAAHSLWTVRPHLYLSMEQFFGTCFLEVAELKIVTLKMTKPGR